LKITVGSTTSIPAARRRRRLVAAIVLALMLLMIVAEIAGFLLTTSEQTEAMEIRNLTRDARIGQQALTDANAGVHAYLFTGSPPALDSYFQSRELLDRTGHTAFRGMDDAGSILERAAMLERRWQRDIASARGGGMSREQISDTWAASEIQLGAIRDAIHNFLEVQNSRSERLAAQIERSRATVLALQVVGGLLALLGLAFAFRAGAAEARARDSAAEEAVASREQVECLFQMADLLQSASGYDDATAVLSATASKLLPGFGGTLYVFNNSRDRLDRTAVWNHPEPDALPPFVAPTSCWAVKRGKWHLNSSDASALHCDHYSGSRAVLEMPMMARGELYGLLSFSVVGDDSKRQLLDARTVATALADAMSLALANIALRERLRNQAIKDPLTGLYNRRYMEDMLERLVGLAERSGRPFSLVMIDLDHFKKLNDEHGHAAGDSALRRAAEALLGNLRDTDIGCRYGGEELVVLLPDCSLDDAMFKAESLRAQIESSGESSLRVTASMGVATIPETSASATSLLAMADAALYSAKKAGRNRVVAAPRCASELQGTLAIAAE
jgi:diguanylate cyclase (GGDEF)-like protein